MKFIWPFDPHYLTRDFYFQDPLYYGGVHAAVDLVSDDPAKPLKAVADGFLWHNPFLDYYGGWTCWIDTDDGWRITYYHMREPSTIPDGSRVKQGTIVGFMGVTGVTLGPHLHQMFWHKVRQSPESLARPNGWWAHDPLLYLGQEDEMTLKLVQVHNPTPDDPIFVTDGLQKIGVATNEQRTDLKNLGLTDDTVYSVERNFIDSLFDVYAAHRDGEHHHDT